MNSKKGFTHKKKRIRETFITVLHMKMFGIFAFHRIGWILQSEDDSLTVLHILGPPTSSLLLLAPLFAAPVRNASDHRSHVQHVDGAASLFDDRRPAFPVPNVS